MKTRLLQVLGCLLVASVLVPLIWDRHDTFWSWRVLSERRYGPTPFLAQAFALFPVALGAFVLVRDRVLRGWPGSAVLAAAAAFGCLSIFGWTWMLFEGLGGYHALSTVVAATVIVVGLVLALGYDVARGYVVAAAGGIAGLVAVFVPFDGYMAADLAQRIVSFRGDRGGSLPLVTVVLGALACLGAVSLLFARGRRLRAWVVLGSLPVIYLMGSVDTIQAGGGPAVERFSGWLGFFVARFCPSAVVLGVAVAELLMRGRAPAGPADRPPTSAPAMTAAECGRRLRLLRDRERAKRLAPDVARRQRVETLRAAVAAARASAAGRGALLAEVAALAGDGSLSEVEAASVRAALPPA